MWFFGQGPVVPVLRFSGPIGMATPLRPGLSIGQAASAIEKAFELSKIPAVAVVINSPGGSPVQSSLIFRRIRQLAEEKKKTVYVFCEDVAASGGYYLALAGDEIYADPSSIIGSIGVIFAGFGLDKAIAKLGIERRVYTAGEQQGRARSVPPGEARGHRAHQERAARRARRVHRHRQGAPRRTAYRRRRRAVLRRLLVRPQGARARAYRRHLRRAQQDARAVWRQGAPEGRTAGKRRPAGPPAAVCVRPLVTRN